MDVLVDLKAVQICEQAQPGMFLKAIEIDNVGHFIPNLQSYFLCQTA